MRVLVATKQGQGKRTNDFSFTKEGELVYLSWTCDRDVGKPDGGCGCARSFSGMETHKGTTTARVAELPMTTEVFQDVLRDALDRAGWLPDLEYTIPEMAEELLNVARTFRVNDILEKRDTVIQLRGRAFFRERGR